MRIAMCDDETRILEEVSFHIKKYSQQSGKSEVEEIDGTLVTESYFSDYAATIALKSDK